MRKLSSLFVVLALAAVAQACGDEDPNREQTERTPTSAYLTRVANIPTEPPTPDAGTAIPEDELVPTTLMFCEPLTQGSGSDLKVGMAPLDVVYTGDGCFADIDSAGLVAAVDQVGSPQRVEIEYVALRDVFFLKQIVWIPARGELGGKSVVMTGKYIERNATVQFTALGAPLALFKTTSDGQEVFGSLTERIIGLPLATFLGNKPLPSEDGRDIIAPTVLARIDEAFGTASISLDTAKRLIALVNSGNAR